MRRTLVVGVFVGVGYLILRTRLPKLHERLMRRCEGMLERMPDEFPPKRAMRGIEEINVKTARILELLEARDIETDRPEPVQRVGAPKAPAAAN